MHVDSHEVDERARAHRPAGAVAHPGVQILRRHARLVEDTDAVVQERDQDAVDHEAGRVVTADRRLPDPRAEREGGLERAVLGQLGADDLDERHQRRRVEEVHPDDTAGRVGRGRDLGDGERRGVGREDGLGPQIRSSSAKSSRFGSSSSTIASITRSQSARSASSVVSVSRPIASSRAACSSCPFSVLRVRKCAIRPRASHRARDVTSRPRVSTPASMQSCAIPAPIAPSPTTPTLRTSATARDATRGASDGGRRGASRRRRAAPAARRGR